MVIIKNLEIEIKLRVNENLYQKKAITEEMYIKARELILKNNKIA